MALSTVSARNPVSNGLLNGLSGIAGLFPINPNQSILVCKLMANPVEIPDLSFAYQRRTRDGELSCSISRCHEPRKAARMRRSARVDDAQVNLILKSLELISRKLVTGKIAKCFCRVKRLSGSESSYVAELQPTPEDIRRWRSRSCRYASSAQWKEELECP
jgi:hypothetical protein